MCPRAGREPGGYSPWRLSHAPFRTLAGDLNAYQLYDATCAELLRQLGHPDQARTAGRRALPCSTNGSPSASGSHPATAPALRRTKTAVQLRGSVLHCCLHPAVRQQTRG
jgi:hypothetical protein